MVYDILKLLDLEERMLKTHICTSANLPLDRCSKILDLLQFYGLVVRVSDEKRISYSITERGYEYIGLYEKLVEIAPFI
ncbi:MAG: winged helix-turn-helix domain-containing protein [Thermoprotei archaeon]